MVTQAAQYIHCVVTSRNKRIDCCMNVVYGYNTINQRMTLWADLRLLANQCNKSWLIWGDFNALLTSQDRIYDAPVTS